MRVCTFVLLFVLLFTSCNQATPAATTPTLAHTATPTQLSTPKVEIIRPPDVEAAVNAFLEAWQAENYEAMYEMLTPVSRDAFAQDMFTRRYIDAANTMTLDGLDFKINAVTTYPTRAQVAFQVTYHTTMIGDLVRDMTMDLSLEKGTWGVQWHDGLVLPELKGGNTLSREMKRPTRGNLYDRTGDPVAAASEIFALGLRKGEVSEDSASGLYAILGQLTNRVPESIRAQYESNAVYEGDYIPVGEVTRDAYMNRYDALSGYTGLYANPYSGRFYFSSGIAPHVTGYVGAIQQGEEDEYKRRGFEIDERVGRAGLEFWGEDYLLGQRGVTLRVNDPNGATVTLLAQVDSKPSQSIYLTIDDAFQIQAQRAIAGFSGGLVVMERDTGRVLAMVSSPGFDPNAFEFLNYNSGTQLGQINGDGRSRLYNRATSDGYPLGSVFKIITLAAALETNVFPADEIYDCRHTFTEIPGVVLYDWTYEKELDPSGPLTMADSLMRSCNPWFYRIGMELFRQGKGTAISEMARAFGLGSITGIEQVVERPGNIPEPPNETEAARIAIGQNEILVNPLQVARFIAAVGNGGTLYRPQVVEKITDPDGNASLSFEPEAQGTLPISEETLAILQDEMRKVVADPRGTAIRAFSGLSIPVYGKTGTAQNDFAGSPHAWFAGYTNAGRADRPDIAFAVIAEYAGEGSDIAAPIARRLVEAYFLGQPQKVYDWEVRINVTRTPPPDEAETPVPPSAPNPGAENPPPSDPGQPVDPGINERTATPSP